MQSFTFIKTKTAFSTILKLGQGTRLKAQLINRHIVKSVLSVHSLRRPKLAFKTDYCLMQVKSIAECSFRPSLSYHLSLRSLFCLFLSGRFRQVLLYQCMIQRKLKPTKLNVHVVKIQTNKEFIAIK